MLKKSLSIFLIAAATIFSTSAFAQKSPVQVTYGVKSDKTVVFEFDKEDPGTYTVSMNFTRLSNSNDREKQQLSVKGYAGPLLTLRPENKENAIGFTYSYSYIRGKLKPKYDPQFVYLLPYKAGTSVRATEAYFFNAKYFGSTTPEDWKYYRFYARQQDSVTAIRKGIVVEVKNDVDDLSADYSYSSKSNKITIEHADGTLANYSGFKRGSISVKLGQVVFPGDALGLNSPQNGEKWWGIALSVTYLKSTDFEGNRKQGLKDSKSLYGFVFPYFCTKENASGQLVDKNEYIAAQTTEIVKKELSKKELKQNIR